MRFGILAVMAPVAQFVEAFATVWTHHEPTIRPPGPGRARRTLRPRAVVRHRDIGRLRVLRRLRGRAAAAPHPVDRRRARVRRRAPAAGSGARGRALRHGRDRATAARVRPHAARRSACLPTWPCAGRRTSIARTTAR